MEYRHLGYPLGHQLDGSADRLSPADESVLGTYLREQQR
jgi:hypothetical protein